MRTTTQLLVTKLLENADRFEWTLQGFGMLRTYLSREVRLHVWHTGLKTEHVSTIHDHPWDFESEVVCGAIRDVVYGERSLGKPTHTKARIRCGVGGGLLSEGETVLLYSLFDNTYRAGDSYSQDAEYLHESFPEDGTVTIVTRRFKEDPEHATVCYLIGTEWVSAEPRPATPEEIRVCVDAALERLRRTE